MGYNILALGLKEWTIIILLVLLALFLVALLVIGLKLHKIKKRAEMHADTVKIVDGVRYSTDKAISDSEGMNISHLPNDFVLKCGETYTAHKDGSLLPGVYTALSANGNDRNFKLRVGGLVKNYTHGDELVLADGDQITAVSTTVILR
jgi:hypothetical protein